MTLTEERTALERPGSARRAAIGMAGTSAIVVLLGGLCLVPAARLLLRRDTFEYSPGWDFFVYGWLLLLVLPVVGVPAISFTFGRSLDRRLAAAPARTSVARFTVAGAVCGLLLAMGWSMVEAQSKAHSDVKLSLILLMFYVGLFAVAGAGGRLLAVLAFKDVRWRVTVWALYAVVMAAVIWEYARPLARSRWFH